MSRSSKGGGSIKGGSFKGGQSAKQAGAAAKTQAVSDYIANDPNFGTTSPDTLAEYTSNPNFGADAGDAAPTSTDSYTPEETAALDKEVGLEQKYGDEPLAAAGYGAVRGLLPAADVIMTKLGVDPEKLRELKERNPVSSGIGEIGGLVGGAALGGESLLGKATLGGGLSASEKAVGEVIAGSVFKNQAEKSIAKKIVEKSMTRALEGVPAGAALGVNELLNENALGEADLNAENLVAAAGAGAALNGLVGGAFGAMEANAPLVSTGLDKITGKFKKATDEVFDLRRNISELAETGAVKRADIYEDLSKVDDDTLKGYIKNRLKLGAADDAEEIFKKHGAAQAQIGKDIQTSYKMIDENLPGGVVPTLPAKQDLLETVENYIQKNPDYFDNKAAMNMAENIKKEIFNRFERIKTQGTAVEGAQDFWALAKKYGDEASAAWKNPGDSPLKSEIYRDLYRKSKEILHENVEKATAGTPIENILGDIKKFNSEYTISKSLESGFEKKAASTPSILGFKDQASAFLGYAVGGGIGSMLTVAGRKFLESDLRRKMVILNAIHATQENTTKKIADAMGAFFKKGAKAGKLTTQAAVRYGIMNSGFAVDDKNKRAKNEQEAFNNMRKNISNLATNPELLARKLTGATMKANYAAPNTARMAQQTLGKAVEFLNQKMPKDSNHGADIVPRKDWQPSNVEMSKFKRYVETVENPLHVLDELKSGTITREHVEALQSVYPKIYEQVQTAALDEVHKQTDMNYNKKIQLGILLNIPTVAAMQPQNILKLQASFTPTPMQQQQLGDGMVKPTVGGTKAIDKSGRVQTGMQEAQDGIQD